MWHVIFISSGSCNDCTNTSPCPFNGLCIGSCCWIHKMFGMVNGLVNITWWVLKRVLIIKSDTNNKLMKVIYITPSLDIELYAFQPSDIIVVPGKIRRWITSIRVAWLRSGTTSRKMLLVSRWTPPKTHWPERARPRLYLRRPNFASSISTTVFGPPKVCRHHCNSASRNFVDHLTMVALVSFNSVLMNSWWGGGCNRK